MRRTLLLTSLALLAACNRGGTAENAVADEQVSAGQTVAANDITAIDAATGDDANMAEDMPLDLNADLNADENATSNNDSAAKPSDAETNQAD